MTTQGRSCGSLCCNGRWRGGVKGFGQKLFRWSLLMGWRTQLKATMDHTQPMQRMRSSWPHTMAATGSIWLQEICSLHSTAQQQQQS